jgi:hypothetical protein
MKGAPAGSLLTYGWFDRVVVGLECGARDDDKPCMARYTSQSPAEAQAKHCHALTRQGEGPAPVRQQAATALAQEALEEEDDDDTSARRRTQRVHSTLNLARRMGSSWATLQECEWVVGEGGFKLQLFGLNKFPQISISTICQSSHENRRTCEPETHLKHPRTSLGQQYSLLDII